MGQLWPQSGEYIFNSNLKSFSHYYYCVLCYFNMHLPTNTVGSTKMAGRPFFSIQLQSNNNNDGYKLSTRTDSNVSVVVTPNKNKKDKIAANIYMSRKPL